MTSGKRTARGAQKGGLLLRWRGLLQAACALAALLPFAAQARVYTEWRPRLSLGAGYDDNVKFDGSGGDGIGEAIPGLKLGVFGEHALHLDLDCEASFARLANPGRFSDAGYGFSNSALCRAEFRDHPAEFIKTHWSMRTTYARDAFAISSLGLLLRAGQTQVFESRLSGAVSQEISTRGRLEYGVFADALNFGTNDPGNGYQVAPQVGYGYRTSERNTFDATVREQLFLGAGATAVPGLHGAAPSGLLAEGTSTLLGFTRRLTPTMTATLRGGPEVVTGPVQAATLFPALRFELSNDLPTSGVHVVLAHDLVLGPSQAGALVGDIAELGMFGNLSERFVAHGRADLYRNSGVDQQGRLGIVGYSGEAGVDFRFGREWSIGVAGVRDARLTQRDGGNVDRDVFQLRLSWEKARQ